MSLITFFHPAFWYGNKHIMIDLFNRESLVSDSASGIWKDGDPITLLFSCAIIRFIIFLFIVLTPVPSGVFAPALVLGGIIGRLFAGILQ